MFHSLRARLWISYAILVITALAVVAIVLMLFLLRNPLLYRRTYLRLSAAESALYSRADPAVSMRSVADALDVRVILFTPTGGLITDSRDGAAGLPLPPTLLGRTHTGVQRDLAGRAWFYSLRRLADGNWLLIAAPRPKAAPVVALLTDELFVPILEGAAVALLLSLVLAFVIARWIADPLQQIIVAAGTSPTDAIRPVAEQGPQEVRALTRAFNDMVTRVQLSRVSQRDFVANVSHELKTPLTSIQGFAQALIDGTADSPDARLKAAHIIFDEAGRMHRMALDLLELAKLDAGTAELKDLPVDTVLLLRGLCDKFQPRASGAGITLRVSLPPELPLLMGDGDRLAQVFGNLVDNALKFTPAGGTITIRAIAIPSEIHVSVIDTGRGIAVSDIPHIFDRFYQADAARQGGDTHGSGLGLAIAREIVAAQGGRISVRSAGGRGTGFVVHLPLRGSH